MNTRGVKADGRIFSEFIQANERYLKRSAMGNTVHKRNWGYYERKLYSWLIRFSRSAYFGALLASSPLNEPNIQAGIEACSNMTLGNLSMRRRERKQIKATTSVGHDKPSLISVGQIVFILCIIVQTSAQTYNDLRKLWMADEPRS